MSEWQSVAYIVTFSSLFKLPVLISELPLSVCHSSMLNANSHEVVTEENCLGYSDRCLHTLRVSPVHRVRVKNVVNNLYDYYVENHAM